MRTVALTQGQFALVDDVDWDLISNYKWTATFNKKWYAKAHMPAGTIYMHRLIMGTPKGLVVRHNDNDGLNNTRSNMRNVTPRENTVLGGGAIHARKK